MQVGCVWGSAAQSAWQGVRVRVLRKFGQKWASKGRSLNNMCASGWEFAMDTDLRGPGQCCCAWPSRTETRKLAASPNIEPKEPVRQPANKLNDRRSGFRAGHVRRLGRPPVEGAQNRRTRRTPDGGSPRAATEELAAEWPIWPCFRNFARLLPNLGQVWANLPRC